MQGVSKAEGRRHVLYTDVMNKEVLEGNSGNHESLRRIIAEYVAKYAGASLHRIKLSLILDRRFQKVVDLNLFGTVLPTMVFAGIMVDQKRQHCQLLFRICTPSVDSCGRFTEQQKLQ